MTSLDAVADGGFSSMTDNENGYDKDNDDDLFAVMMSPRSPEMTTSPFSFSVKDIAASQAR